MKFHVIFISLCLSITWSLQKNPLKQWKVAVTASAIALPFFLSDIQRPVDAGAIRLQPIVETIRNKLTTSSAVSTNESPYLKLARKKRTDAIKAMEEKGIVKIHTDDIGNQFLMVPWIPNQRLLYKSIPFDTRLWNELCAGALGEISKDVLLHAVDTAKTRRQAKKKSDTSNNTNMTEMAISSENPLQRVKDLCAGFPAVAISSIPQGGAFFLVKKGSIEFFNVFLPSTPSFITSTVPIGLGVMMYWLFRTPAEVLKTQVQTYQYPSVKEAFENAKTSYSNGLAGLWKHYPVVLWLDIPFQIINFILFSYLSDVVLNAGVETSFLSRLFCGVTCGMISAGLTCPLDVCKTRIIARDRAAMTTTSPSTVASNSVLSLENNSGNMAAELVKIFKEEGLGTLFLGLGPRLLYVGLANGIRLSAYGTSRMDLMMRSLDNL